MRLSILARVCTPSWRRAAIALPIMALLGISAVFASQVTYEYDEVGRLRSVVYDDGKQTDYVLDASGNRVQAQAWNAPLPPIINDIVIWSGTGNFTVSWAAGGGAAVVTRYELYQSINGTNFDAAPLVNSLATSYAATGRAEGRYFYRVRACTAEGCGRFATWVSSFNVDLTAPAPVTGLATTSVAQTTASLSWNASTDNFELRDYQYRLLPSQTWISAGTTPAVNLTGLAPQTGYVLEVRASDAAGNLGPPVSHSFTTIVAPPAPPTGLSYRQVAECAWHATWSPLSGATSYVLRDTMGNEQSMTGTSANIVCPLGNPQGNKPNWVKACNAGGCSSESNFPPNGFDGLAPSTPSGLQAIHVQPTTATISWTASTDNVGVAGYQYALNSGNWNGLGATSVGLTGLTDNFTHTVYVRAYDAAGNFSGTVQVSFTTPTAPDTTPPSATPNLRISSLGSSSIVLNWDAAADNIGVVAYDYRLTTSSSWLSTTALAATVGVSSSTAYTFEVRARDAATNLGAVSSIGFTTPAGVPDPPADAWASLGGSCYWNTWWSAPSSGPTPTYYRLRESGTGTERNVTTQPATVNFPPCTNPQSNKPSWVKACNAQGCSTARNVRF